MNPADTLLQIEERLLDEAPSHGLPLDVVQDSFVSAYQSLGSFKGDSEFYTDRKSVV